MLRAVMALAVVLGWGGGAGAGEVELVIASAQVMKTKANGKAWDAGNGLPDPYVLVRMQTAGKKKSKELARTAVQKDTFEPRWNHRVPGLGVGDVLTVEVWDKDVAEDDLIGRHTFTITEALLKQRDLCLSFGQVEELRLVLKGPQDAAAASAARKGEGAGPPGSAPLNKEQQDRLKERDQLRAEVEKLHEAGKVVEAIAATEKALAIERSVLGPRHEDVGRSLAALADLHEEREDFAAARQAGQQALAILSASLGKAHWRVTDVRLVLEDVELRARMTPAQRQRLGEAKRLAEHLKALYGRGKFDEAVRAGERLLAIRKEVLGERHPEYAESLNNLAEVYHEMGNHTQAEVLLRQALAIAKETLGDNHPEYAAGLNNLAGLHFAMGEYAKAEPLFRQALAIRKQALGEQHADYASSLHNLALLYKEMGDYAKAEPLYRQALAIAKEAQGDKHPDYANSLDGLATLYEKMGDYVQADRLYQQALAIRKQALGDKHPAYARTLLNLALLYGEMGDYAKAEPLCRQALAITKEALGDRHPDYAAGLNNLAILYLDMADYARAEPLFQQVLSIRKQALGDKHPDYATSLNNLAALYMEMGGYAQAEPLFRQALALQKEALGDKHPACATSLDNLAVLYKKGGAYAKAEPLFRQALAIRKEALGDKHIFYATSLNNLAALYEAMGEFGQAEPLYKQALAIDKQARWEKHNDYAIGLNNLATLYRALGDDARAERLLRQGLEISRDNLDLAAAAQSERQQLGMAEQLRAGLDAYLALAPQAKSAAEPVYAHVLAWKGAVLARQRRLRLKRSHPELAATFGQLDQVAGRLAALALAAPDPKQQAAYRQQIQELTEKKELLESDLAHRSAAFRQAQQTQRLAPARLQAVLPADAGLVDFLEYTHASPPSSGKGRWVMERRLAAFVVRAGKPVVRVDLGPAQPITKAVEAWRQALQRRFRTAGDAKLGDAVRRLVWVPLAEHVQGARVVLVSPNGALARVPFAALPGSKKDSYLLEEVAVAVVPVPQLLPELLVPRPDEAKAEPSLLLVGDVRYDANPGNGAVADSRAAPRGGSLAQWKALENTRAEVAAIKDSFQRRFRQAAVTDLREDEATEAAFRKQAPSHRYLHLATHGFFAPPQLRSALAEASHGDRADAADLFSRQGVAGFHPGLLSGLVLAGANRPPQPDRDDGILTALEVEALDLSGVELAVLSACETGLGEEAGGEGLLGLQRAFQVAGARSVVAGLWQVDDKATRELMVRFYENLWKRQLPRLEALRQAQLWMLKEGAGRGVTDVRVPKERLPVEDGRLPPYYWAAFALSGDWR